MRTRLQFFGNNIHHQSAFLVNPAKIIKHTARFAILKLFFPVKLRRPNVLQEKPRNKTPHTLCCCRCLRRLTKAFQPIKKRPQRGVFLLAASPGFEPRLTESESAVLPLDDEAICRTREYLCHFKLQVNNFFKKTVSPETIFRLHFRQFSITLNSAVRKSPAVRTGKRFGVVTDLDNNGLDIVR